MTADRLPTDPQDRNKQLARKVSLRGLRSPKFEGWESPSLLARLLDHPKPSTCQAV